MTDSLESGILNLAASSDYVYTSGTVNGSFIPNNLDTPSTTFSQNGKGNVIVKYNSFDGSLKNVLQLDPKMYTTDLKVDEDNQLWAIGTYLGQADLDPSDENTIMSTGEEGIFLNCFNSEDSLIYSWHKEIKSLLPSNMNIGDNHIIFNAPIRGKSNQDTAIFGGDTIFLGTGTESVYLLFDKEAKIQGTISADYRSGNGGLTAILDKSEIHLSTPSLSHIRGLIDTTLNQGVYESTYWIYDLNTKKYRLRKLIGIQREYPVGIWGDGYFVLTDSLILKQRDHGSDQVLYSFTPSVVNQGFQSPVYKTDFGKLYTYGEVRGKLNFGTDSLPRMITDGTDNSSSQDHYFGVFDSICQPIIDATIYEEDIVQ